MNKLVAICLSVSICLLVESAADSAQAKIRWFHKKNQSAQQTQSAAPPKKSRSKRHGATTKAPPKTVDGTAGTIPADTSGTATAGDDSSQNGPVVVAPQVLVDLYTAKFGELDIDLKDASFLDATVKKLHLASSNLDMASGTLNSLLIDVNNGMFQDFNVDDLNMTTTGALKFDTNELLNNKILQFKEPISAQAKAVISQSSLNTFLNSQKVLARLSSAAKKRVPFLSALARQDVTFGFDFLAGKVELLPEDKLRIAMDSKVGMGKAKIAMPLSAETKLALANGWVNLGDTRLLTSGQMVPHDMATKIVNRINSLSKWGSASDDIRFQFTDLKVVPDDRLELQGSAIIKRIRLTREKTADNTSK